MKEKTNKKLVSILISTYNDSLFIKETISSVQNQKYTNWELIIIDDASTDNAAEIIKTISEQDKRILFYQNKSNKGLIANLNLGAEMAKGEYIARIDGDDVWVDRDKIGKQVNLLDGNKELTLIGTWANRIDSIGNFLSTVKYPIVEADIRNYLAIENCFINSSVMFTKSAFQLAHGYEKQFLYCEDYTLWLKMGNLGKLANIPEFMVSYRINPNGISNTKYRAQIENTIRTLKKYGTEYPNYTYGLFLWYIRNVLPKSIRENLSKIVRETLFFAK
ncbi:MAG: glycosyltransferase family 2 protein [Candidatus Woesebacteria bacterium]